MSNVQTVPVTPRRRPAASLLFFYAALAVTAVSSFGVSVSTRAAKARGDQRGGNQITDNLGFIVIGVVAIVAIGVAITTLYTNVFNDVEKSLGL